LSFVAKSGSMSPYMKATVSAVAGAKQVINPPAVLAASVPAVFPDATPAERLSGDTLRRLAPRSLSGVSVTSGVRHTTSVRYAHTDIRVPDFSAYRRKEVQNPAVRSRDSEDSRKSFTYLITASGVVTGAYCAKTIVTDFVSSMSASADVLALAKIEIKLGDIPEGKNVTFKWRGKPLFIRHRTAEEIDSENKVDISTLRDPQPDSDRVKKTRMVDSSRGLYTSGMRTNCQRW